MSVEAVVTHLDLVVLGTQLADEVRLGGGVRVVHRRPLHRPTHLLHLALLVADLGHKVLISQLGRLIVVLFKERFD